MIKGCVMKKMAGAPTKPPRSSVPRIPSRTAAPVQSITRTEIDHFWRKKKLEEEEHQLAIEKEAARIKVKELKLNYVQEQEEDYMIFEQRINRITGEKTVMDKKMSRGEITKNSKGEAILTRDMEIRIGIKDWWRNSSYAYLNELSLTSMDENSRWGNSRECVPQKIYFGLSPSYLVYSKY